MSDPCHTYHLWQVASWDVHIEVHVYMYTEVEINLLLNNAGLLLLLPPYDGSNNLWDADLKEPMEEDRAKMGAFAMSHHNRLGMHSASRHLLPEIRGDTILSFFLSNLKVTAKQLVDFVMQQARRWQLNMMAAATAASVADTQDQQQMQAQMQLSSSCCLRCGLIHSQDTYSQAC